jgi:hypothetical protein
MKQVSMSSKSKRDAIKRNAASVKMQGQISHSACRLTTIDQFLADFWADVDG